MADNEIRNTGSFSYEITSSSGSSIITILDIGQLNAEYAALATDYYVGCEFLLESLQVTVNLKSFAKAPIPNIAPEDTQAERQTKIYDIQNRFSKLGLTLFKSVGGGEFKRQSLPVLQNPGNEWYLPLLQPYLTMTQVKLLGKLDKLGVQITNLGNGTLGSGDTLLLEGSWRHILTLTKKLSQQIIPNSFGQDIGAIPTLIRPSQPKRRLLWIVNPSDRRIWYAFGNSPQVVTVGNCPCIEPGGSINLEMENYYLPDQLWGIVEAGESETPRLTGIEGVLM